MGQWFCRKYLIVSYMCFFVISKNAPLLPEVGHNMLLQGKTPTII